MAQIEQGMLVHDRPGHAPARADGVDNSPRSPGVAPVLVKPAAIVPARADPLAASRQHGDRVQFFDQLRAFAIFVVLVGHYRHDVFPGGSIGVSVFFALSGYLITSILLGEPVLDRHSVWRFVVRRFLRVWPPYFVAATAILVLMYCAVLVLERQGPGAADAYAAQATRFDAYLGDFGKQLLFLRNPSWLGMGVGVFWTLQIEFWFYLTMPLLMLAVGRGRRLEIALVVLLALSLGLRFFPQLNSVWPISLAYGVSPLIIHVAKWFDTLLAGALVAVVAHRQVLAPISRERFRTISTVALGLLAFIVLFIANDDRHLVWPLMATASGLITCFWILAFIRSDAAPDHPWIAWFGRISYSVYLVHAIPLDYMRALPWPTSGFLLYSRPITFMLLSILVAVALHHLVEKPAIRLGKYLTRRRQPATAPVGAAA